MSNGMIHYTPACQFLPLSATYHANIRPLPSELESDGIPITPAVKPSGGSPVTKHHAIITRAGSVLHRKFGHLMVN
jgi:hypothetical protein